MPERDPVAARDPEPTGPLQQAPDRDPGGRPPARIPATRAAREAIRRLRVADHLAVQHGQQRGMIRAGLAAYPAGLQLGRGRAHAEKRR